MKSSSCGTSMGLTAWAWCLLAHVLSAGGVAAEGTGKESPGTVDVRELRCEGCSVPLGVDVDRPHLDWQLQSDTRDMRQVACQVQAASTPALLAGGHGDLWDSGRVDSSATFGMVYGGRPLGSAQQVFWRVRVWGSPGPAHAAGAGRPSAWSEPASWTMGIVEAPGGPPDRDARPAGWHASWISAPPGRDIAFPVFRREFNVPSNVTRAVVNVCGLGHFEMTLNGRKITDALLAPGWSKYDRTCLYETYDVTPLIRRGSNAAGLMLGSGMYDVSSEASGTRYHKFTGSFGALKAIAQIRLEFGDGHVEFVGTDPQWRVARSPLTFSNVYGGEDYDARLELPGWNEPDFDDSRWASAAACSGPGGRLRGFSCAAPPIRAHDVFTPCSTRIEGPGVSVCDFGQNASQMPRVRVRGAAGSSVRLVPAELVHADGSIDPSSSRNGDAWWQYTLRGDPGGEVWFPRFFYNGYRYLRVELHPAPTGAKDSKGADAGESPVLPTVDWLQSVVVHSDSAPVGHFECSDALFNRIEVLIRWAQRSNMMSVLTDCPHREKLGWLEQIYLNGPSLRYEFDVGHLVTKALNDMADSQLPNGLVPTIAPEYTIFTDRDTPPGGRGVFGDSPEWGSALVQAAWQEYIWTGSPEVLARFYASMRRYTLYVGSRRGVAGLVNYGLGDWYDIGPGLPGKAQLTPVALTATATYYADLDVMARTATLLGRRDDATLFSNLASVTRSDFNRVFFNGEKGSYSTGSQTSNALPLVVGLVPGDQVARVLAALVADVRSRGNALTAGDIGYTYLLRALAAGGRSDVIFDMNHQSDRPGYGFQLAHGATSLTEAWDGLRSSSQNHFMLGHLMEWFYRDLAGIGIDPSEPGFARIMIRPSLVGTLTWVRARYDSARGPIRSGWRRNGNQGTFEIEIPQNSTATLLLPAMPGSATESGLPVGQSPGIHFLRMDGEDAVIELGGGRYTITTVLPPRYCLDGVKLR